MAKIKITQIKSTIKRPTSQKLTIQALKLGKLHRTVEYELTPQIEGMVRKVHHLVTTEIV
jgi:large subunit ribosomal protein L30